jgi:hypothetical protein
VNDPWQSRRKEELPKADFEMDKRFAEEDDHPGKEKSFLPASRREQDDDDDDDEHKGKMPDAKINPTFSKQSAAEKTP